MFNNPLFKRPSNQFNVIENRLNRRDILACLFLCIIIITVYGQVINHAFLWDDEAYITNNFKLQQGLSKDNILWSFKASVASNWHPLTLMSHMLDCQLYGLNAGLHHLTNLLFHIANSLLLFIVLSRMTRAFWQSTFVAVLFALHPLHVESVAWVAERKDVLSTFYWMLALWFYIRYVARPVAKTYIPVIACLVLGLMAKPMVVTLPFVLLLLDYWPLKRFQFKPSSGFAFTGRDTSFKRIVLEKLPLLVFSTASCVVTFIYQQGSGSVSSINKLSLYERFSNSIVSYMNYILNMIWPFELSVFYPYSKSLPSYRFITAFIAFALLTYLAFRSIKRHPFISVGWFWYIGTLVPVIGLVQVGSQAMADRYMYIPSVGIYIIVSWGAPVLFSKFQYKAIFLKVFYLVIIGLLLPVTWLQVKHWKSGVSLFEHALNVTEENSVAHVNLAFYLSKKQRTDEAIYHLRKALEITPLNVKAHTDLGVLLGWSGKTKEAIEHFNLALKVKPKSKATHLALGSVLAIQGDKEKALEHLNAGLNNITKAYLKLGNVLSIHGRYKEATHYFNEARISDPENASPYQRLGDTMKMQKQYQKSILYYSKALKLNPDHKKAKHGLVEALFMRGSILIGKGQINDAVDNLKKAIIMDNNCIEAHSHLGYSLHLLGNDDEAVKHCLKAIRIDPDKSTDAYYYMSLIYAKKNKINESISWVKKAIDNGFNNWDALEKLDCLRDSAYYNKIIKTVRPDPMAK